MSIIIIWAIEFSLVNRGQTEEPDYVIDGEVSDETFSYGEISDSDFGYGDQINLKIDSKRVIPWYNL